MKFDYEKIGRMIEELEAKYSNNKKGLLAYLYTNANSLGIEPDSFKSSGHFKLIFRPEKTPSVYPGRNFSVHDFGTGETFSIFELIQRMEGCSFQEAVIKAYEMDGNSVSPEEIQYKFQKFSEEGGDIRPPYSEKYIRYTRGRATDKIIKPIYEELLKGLFRSCSKKEIIKGIELFSIGIDSYKKEETEEELFRLVIIERDYEGVPWGSFRYNRSLDPKGLRRKNSKKVLIGEHLLPRHKDNKPILFTEGHSDCVVCNAKGLLSVSSGSATSAIPEDSLKYLANKEVHFFGDADLAGIRGLIRKSAQIEEWNKNNPDKIISYKLFFWAETFKQKIRGEDGQEIEVILKAEKAFKDMYEEYNSKQYSSDHPLEYKELKKKIVIAKTPLVKQGYDFIDFFNDSQDKKWFSSWKKRYSQI